MARHVDNGSKTLDQLEKSPVPPKGRAPGTVRIRTARQTPLRELTAEQLLILLHTGEGASHLLPYALDRLEEEPCAAIEFHPGDLLLAVLNTRPRQWPSGSQGLPRLRALAQSALKVLAKAPKHLRNPGIEAELKTWLGKHKAT